MSIKTESHYETYKPEAGGLVKAWVKGVPFEEQARKQVDNIASMPFIHRWVAVMPDVHMGRGATVGSVIPTTTAIIPAAVGVDIGCGMIARKTTLKAEDLPTNLAGMRKAIERAVPHGRQGGRSDPGAWSKLPDDVRAAWSSLAPTFKMLVEKYPTLERTNNISHLGTLGTGNHFVEVCLDESNSVWLMLHSGSRGVGNAIGTMFIGLAREDMRKHQINLPDIDLAYLSEGTEYFNDYVEAVDWAQNFARLNREIMMKNTIAALTNLKGMKPFFAEEMAVNCHHNYVQREYHFGKEVYLTRKGAVRAGLGDLGIIPGSMGAKSFIVRGKGNVDSFSSCSHGAGRVYSRTEAKKRFSLEDHKRATKDIECRKDQGVIDETPGAYKPIEQVMDAQRDLVEVVHTLRQIVCVKG